MHEFMSGCDDPETGVFAWVRPKRDPCFQALSIAAAVALAECGGGEVVDEYGYFKGPRMNPPGELLSQLRIPPGADSVTAAVDMLLSRTRLRR
ncbi:hypothetical protein ACWDV4_13425 [Micromonospora sp. NPDC003197]